MKLLRARGLAELGQVALDSAKQGGLSLGNRKVKSQAVGEDEADSVGEEQLGGSIQIKEKDEMQ